MSTYSVGKDIQALVADVGSFSTKIGYAGDDHPQAIYNSTTAVVRNNNGDGGGGASSSCFLKRPKRDFVTRPVEGENAGDGKYELANPVDDATGWLFSPPGRSRFGGASLSSNESNGNNGTGGDADGDGLCDAWESHELISRYLHHAFQNALGLDIPSNSLDHAHNHPLLLLDKPHTPPALRQRILEILFETHDLPAVFLLRDAIASCYAVGRTTATVVDVGYSSATVTPVYEGFVETRGVRRNVACGAKATEERVLQMMDGMVKKQGGRRRKDRMRRRDQRRLEKEQGEASANSNNAAVGNGNEQQQATDNSNTPPKRSSAKRDAHGHFIKESTSLSASLAPIPEYLMPLYQVRRAPKYTPRSGEFHQWSRMTLAREIKEMGLGVAVGPMGYVSSAAAKAGANNANNKEGEDGAAEGGANSLNPATANNVFLQSSKLPYTLPDGTPVEITTASRCDVVEVFFGNDEINSQYREEKLDEAMGKLDEYETEIENYVNSQMEEEETKDVMVGITSSESAAGDAYSNTSYKGEKFSGRGRGGRGNKKTHYSPSTISNKLYSACLPYVRTTPTTNAANENGLLDGGADKDGSGINDNYYHYLTSAPPAQMVCDAAFRCDRDQQAALLGNVVVCGGGACITGAASVGGMGGGAGTNPNLPGGGGGGGAMASALGDEHAFPDRLREEVEQIVHRHTPGWRVKVTSPNISERAICSWLGGSILGSLGTFRDMWISKRDYEEFGSAIVNRKCP